MSQKFKIALTYGAGITTCFAVFSGVQHVITLILCIGSGIVAVGGFFYSFTPIFFMDMLYIIIKFSIDYISTYGVIRLLSGLLFGRFLTGMIETHGDLPEIGVASCKLILIITQEKWSGLIFQQFEHADALIKLISVVEKRLEYVPTSPISKKKYATVLAPMVKVLQMLVKTYHKQQKRNSLRLIAFQLMREYRDSPFTSAEDVADVVGSAACILEYLIANYGGLTFDDKTACYTTTSSTDESNSKLRNALMEMVDDKEFCTSLKTIVAQKEGSLHTAGSVFRLLYCLLQADLMCKDSNDSNARVLDILYPSSSEPLVLTLIHLLERESSALAAHDAEMVAIMSEREGEVDMSSIDRSTIKNAVIALIRMCTHTGILAMLPAVSTNSVQEAADAGLALYLKSFGDWAKQLLTSNESLVEVKRLLQLLLTFTGKFVDGNSIWKEASKQYRALSIVVGQGIPEKIAAVEAEARLLRQENEILHAEIVKLTSPEKEALKASRDLDSDCNEKSELFATPLKDAVSSLPQNIKQLKNDFDGDSEGSEENDFFDTLKHTNRTLSEKIQLLEGQLSEKGATVEKLTLSLADAERRLESEDKDKELVATKFALDDSNIKIRALTSELQSTQESNNNLSQKLKALEGQLSEKGATVEKLTLSLADAERSLLAVRLESEDKDKELVATKFALDDSNIRIHTLTSELQTTQESNNNLSKKLKALEVSNSDLTQKLQQSEERGKKAIAEKAIVTAELQAVKQAHNSRIAALADELDTAKNSIAALTGKLQQSEDDLRKAHATFNSQLESAKATSASLTQQLEESQVALNSANQGIVSYTDKLKSSKETIDDLSQKLQQSEETVQNLIAITESNSSKIPAAAVLTPKEIDPQRVLATLTERDRVIRAERLHVQTTQTKLSDTLTALSINKLTGHRGAVLSVSFSPDGACLASGSLDRTIRLWSMVDGSSLNTLNGHENSVLSLSFSPGGSILASGSQDKSVGIWSTVDGSLVRFLHGHTNTVNSVSFSHDGRCLASGSSDNTIRVWSIIDGHQLLHLNKHTSIVSSVSFSPDDSTLASGSWDQTILVWSMSDGSIVRKLTGHNNLVNSVIFSTDGSRLASGSADKTVRVWSMVDQSPPITMLEHTNLVNEVSFSPDGSRLASGSSDRTIKLWSVSDGKFILSLTGHSSAVTSLCFSRDGSCLASGSQDNTIRFWFF